MRARELRLGALILAAGAGSRFSPEPGAKLLAELDRLSLLDHVLGAVRAADVAEIVVVLGYGADAIERAMAWQGERRVRNPAPERGMGSSLKVGIEALEPHADELDGAFIVLGDQPRLRTEVLSALADAAARARPADRPLVVPRYAADVGPRNPVLLLRPAWLLVDELDDERGLGPFIDRHPDMVQTVEVGGSMPDVDTPTDLDALRRL